MAGKPEFPWFIVLLCTAALLCHSLVFVGNIHTATMFNKLGSSAQGWSLVGLNLGDSLSQDVDLVMGEVSTRLTDVISATMQVKAGIDKSILLIGGSTDRALAQVANQTNTMAFQLLALAASTKAGWLGPRAKPAAALHLAIFAPNGTAEPQGNVAKPEMSLSLGQSDELVWRLKVRTPGSVFENLTYPFTDDDVKSNKQVLQWCLDHPDKAKPVLNAFLAKHNDESNALYKMAGKNATEWAVATANDSVDKLVASMSRGLAALFEKLRPALFQIAEWLSSFGTKVQATIESFGITIDKVQKLFDAIMQQLAESKGWDSMLHESYNLFDASNTGSISASDLKEVGEVYGISVFAGDSAQSMLTKYDADEDDALDKDEFALFLQDPAIPGAMAVVLRAYSKKLAQVSGTVGSAKKRDEVSSAVVEYLELLCVKNLTKVGWISEALTNGSLPMEFTADVLKNMAMDLDNQAKLRSVGPGPILVKTMVELNPDYVAKTLELLSNTSFWSAEGFDPQDQPVTIERIAQWVVDAGKVTTCSTGDSVWALWHGDGHFYGAKIVAENGGNYTVDWNDGSSDHRNVALRDVWKGDKQCQANKQTKHGDVSLLRTTVHHKMYSLFGGSSAGDTTLDESMIEAMPSMAAKMVAERSHRHLTKERAYRAQAHAKLFSTGSAKVLFTELYGGATAGSTVEDPEAHAAVQSGVDAHPDTLAFARRLAENTSVMAKRLQEQCFDFMGDSSSTLDSFATQIQAFVKKSQNFLNMMQDYCTPTGIAQLEEMITDFNGSAQVKIKQVIMNKVYQAAEKGKLHFEHFDLPHALNISQNITEAEDPGMVFMAVKKTLDTLQAILPQVVNDVKFAKKEAAAVATQLNSVFETFGSKGPPIFEDASALYTQMWATYFVLFVALTLATVFYAFLASGWIGRPAPNDAADGETYQPPSGFVDRCQMCLSACSTMVAEGQEDRMTFWSCVILCEIIVLFMFVVAVMLTVVSGVRAFMGVGCSSIFLLSDPVICTGILQVVKGWLAHFWEDAATSIYSVCESNALLTCQLIHDKLIVCIVCTTIGSIGAAMLSFQMIVGTAQLHEQQRWLAIVESYGKEM